MQQLEGFPFLFGSSQGGVVLPSGSRFVAPGISAADLTGSTGQYVIPRYADGFDHPAGKLIGFGPDSILHADENTANQAIKAVVYTEGWGQDISEWYRVTAGKQQAVLRPVVANLTIAGYSTDEWQTSKPPGDPPNVQNLPVASWPDLYDGLLMLCSGGVVAATTISCIPGTGLIIQRPITQRGGQIHPLDKLKPLVADVTISRCYRGLWYDCVDGIHEGSLEVFAYRDYGVKIGTESGAGGIKFGDIHVFGGGHDDADYQGPGLIMAGGFCSGDWYYADTVNAGLAMVGNHCSLTRFESKDCVQYAAKITGSHCVIKSGWMQSSSGLIYDIWGQDNILRDQTVDVSGSGTAFRLSTGQSHRLVDFKINAFEQANAKGIVAAAELNNCVLDGEMIGGSIGIDLFPGGVTKLGLRNTIKLKTRNSVATPINLPPSWHASNIIEVDNVVITP